MRPTTSARPWRSTSTWRRRRRPGCLRRRSAPATRRLIVNWTGIDTSRVPRSARLSGPVRSRRRAAGVHERHLRRRVPDLPVDADRRRGQHATSSAWIPTSSARRCCTQTASSFRMKILQNDITYGVSRGRGRQALQRQRADGVLRSTRRRRSASTTSTATATRATPMPGGAARRRARASGGYCAVSGSPQPLRGRLRVWPRSRS